MSIAHDLFMMKANDVRNHPKSEWGLCTWAICAPDRKRGYWRQRLQGKVLRRLRYQRMFRRRGGFEIPFRVYIRYLTEAAWGITPEQALHRLREIRLRDPAYRKVRVLMGMNQ